MSELTWRGMNTECRGRRRRGTCPNRPSHLLQHARRPSWRNSTDPTQNFEARSGPPAISRLRRESIEPSDARWDVGAEREGKHVLGGSEFTSRESCLSVLHISLWLSHARTKYVPAAQEPVIGIVSARQGEGWRVDIGSAHQASLDGLAFEGASRRNRPNLKVRWVLIFVLPDCEVNRRQVNSLVYARVSLAHKDMEPELECFDAQTRKAEGFGDLKEGFLVRCSLKMSREYVTFFTNCFGSRRIS